MLEQRDRDLHLEELTGSEAVGIDVVELAPGTGLRRLQVSAVTRHV